MDDIQLALQRLQSTYKLFLNRKLSEALWYHTSHVVSKWKANRETLHKKQTLFKQSEVQ